MPGQLRWVYLACSLVMSCIANSALGQGVDNRGQTAFHPDSEASWAQVEIDGTSLFRVFGVPAFPADERAKVIAARIEAAAADADLKPEGIRNVESEVGIRIVAGDTNLMVVTDDDARLDGIERKLVAEVYADRIRKAVVAWRAARSAGAIERGVLMATAATLAFAAAMALMFWLRRKALAAMARYRTRIHSLGIQSFKIVRSEHIVSGLGRAVRFVGTLIVATIAFVYLDYVLRLFPWTRGTSIKLLGYVLEPLAVMGRGLLRELPSIIFLVILFLIIRWLLKVVRLFFDALGRAEVTIQGFEAEWAAATYKVVRLLVIAFAVIVAYPYIPGSSSDAFKGVSLFIGVVFSLGSSSIIANMLAGYMMTYRRAFRLGDRVKIGDVVGDVTEMRLQVTHLRTVKNEEVVVPNSTILSSEVINYSVRARTEGLILHTTVRIGYETPWRQVEAMLIDAARRTPGFNSKPDPFIRQQSLGDFSVTYEINAYCGNAQAMNQIYTDLHRNILDVFNEHGVQIMTPAYEGDPPEPKVVPKEKWFASPALPEK